MQNKYVEMKFHRRKEKPRPNLLMGQRFLTSRPILGKIIDSAVLSESDTVLEIGPGTGALTIELAKKAGRVIAVEKDKRLFELLKYELKRQKIGNVRLVLGDIIKLDLSGFGFRTSGFKVVANIPYYLTSRLIRIFLESENQPTEIFFMVQKEVAERIIAKPPRMNLLALSVQVYAEPEILFAVPRGAFSPQPKVDSAFVKIIASKRNFFNQNSVDEKTFFKIIRAAFAGKRKILENTLAKNMKIAKTPVKQALASASLSGKRPEELALDGWAALVRCLNKLVLP